MSSGTGAGCGGLAASSVAPLVAAAVAVGGSIGTAMRRLLVVLGIGCLTRRRSMGVVRPSHMH